ncbi:MAG: helix-turn-helix domain-containing protein [Caldilineaceae bacterium]|nr:helix-turn-helix domain-containing protein [Caldilineaceae bacterium]
MSLEDRFDMERQGGLTYLREHYGLNPSELYVVNMLVRFNQGGACFPTQDKIAWETGLPIRNVKRALDSLTAKGAISRSKQPYYDKRGRFRAGKIYHYFLSGAISFAVQVGHPQDAARARNGTAPSRSRQDQAAAEQASDSPEAIHSGLTNGELTNGEFPKGGFAHGILPDKGQNGTERAEKAGVAEVQMPDRCQNGTMERIKMAPTECQNGTNEGADPAPHKEVREGSIEGEEETGADPSSTAGGDGGAVVSPKELFNRLLRDKALVPTRRYDYILGQVRAEIEPLPTRESKDAQVMAWADRILAGEFSEADNGTLAAD